MSRAKQQPKPLPFALTVRTADDAPGASTNYWFHTAKAARHAAKLYANRKNVTHIYLRDMVDVSSITLWEA